MINNYCKLSVYSDIGLNIETATIIKVLLLIIVNTILVNIFYLFTFMSPRSKIFKKISK